MLSYWLYVSEALTPARSVEDVLLYFQSRNRNPTRQITGYLHRSSTHYAQYVEGPVDMVDLLKARIVEDARHTAIRTLGAGATDARRFAGWDMAFSFREITAFEDYQHLRGRSESIMEVGADELLRFMLAMTATTMATEDRGRATAPCRSDGPPPPATEERRIRLFDPGPGAVQQLDGQAL